jgi:type VI secretion system secreted protein VgrG
VKHQLAINTSLGADKLRLRRFTYSDQLGRLFRLEAELVSSDYDLVFEDVVGTNATVELALPNGATRCFHGVISAFTQGQPVGNHACYHATIVPWLWLLTRTADCRIYQKDMSVPDILKAVFNDDGFQDVQDHLKASYRPWLYCVQYRETDFNFVSRLMEQEGIYYYWHHTKDKHDLVLVDDPTAHDPVPGYDQIKYRSERGGATGGEVIFNWSTRHEIQPGDYALNDFDYEKPRSLLRANASLRRQHGHAGFEFYDYPGEYAKHAEGEAYAKVRIQELQAQYEVLRGVSDARGLAVGSIFSLEEHPRRDQNQSYLVTAVDYTVGPEDYESGTAEPIECHCAFEAIPAGQALRTGSSDSHRRRPQRRGDLYRRPRPGQSPVPLGSLR